MSELVKEVSEVVSLFTTRYQKTREAREAKEPINFNCYPRPPPLPPIAAKQTHNPTARTKKVGNSLF